MVSLSKKTAVFPLLILLLAASLRLWALTEIPPGLTHDEADHGITAWSIVEGVRAIYFTIGYGREPFYDYITAVLMNFLGSTYLAGRLTAVFFSLLLVAAMYRWVKQAFDLPTALLTAFGLATSFWPLMTGRQALRSTMLPTLFALAVLVFWVSLVRLAQQKASGDKHPALYASLFGFALAGLLVGLTFYTYIPARILWAVFPATAVYLLFVQRGASGRVWGGVALLCAVAAVVAWPLFQYLAANPGTEVRIDELWVPLTAVRDGNFSPLLQNVIAGLRLITYEGDSSLRYNLPGRPFLQPLIGFLFYLGVITAVWQALQPLRLRRQISITHPAVASFLAIVWLLAGLSPSLVTGSRWSMTQAIGMQPVLYLFPAIGIGQLGRFRLQATPLARSRVGWLLVAGLWLITAVRASNDYFNQWANDPAVRVQYEATMVAAMHYLNEQGNGDVVVSTITPDNPHTPALAQMVLNNSAVTPHWFNGQHSLLIPNAPQYTALLSGFALLPPALEPYFAAATLQTTLPLRETDLDRPLLIYHVQTADLWQTVQDEFTLAAEPTQFGEALTFLGHDLQTAVLSPGETMQLVTLWQIEQPLPNAQLFTHVLAATGQPIAQADRLGVPGEGWQVGDRFIQLHEIRVGEETAVGSYSLAVGLYTTHDGERQPLFINGSLQGNLLQLPPLQVAP